jgi:hypothetical protein
MTTAYQVFVCGSIVLDPLQTLPKGRKGFPWQQQVAGGSLDGEGQAVLSFLRRSTSSHRQPALGHSLCNSGPGLAGISPHMDADEREVYYYVKSRRPQCVSERDIGRHVGGKGRFRYNPEWTKPVLLRMIERGILETGTEGSYRLKAMPKKETAGKCWTSPHIAKILEASGKAFGNVITVEDEDEYYIRL